MKENQRPKTFFITGGAGFVGANVVRKLIEKKCEVHLLLQNTTAKWRIADLLQNEYVKVHEGDLLDAKKLKKLVEKIQPDVIYHFAARGAYPTQNDAQEILQTNILGTWNLLAVTSEVPYQLFVNTGSSSEYGFKTEPMRESDLLEPASYYAVAKSASTLLCQYEAISKQKPVVTLRLFSVYGPYEEPSRFVPTLMKKLYTHETLQLVAPETARDFIYIDDLVDFYLDLEKLQQQGGKYFNLGTGQQSTIKDVVETAQKVSGQKAKCEWGKMEARQWDTACWVADATLTKKTFGWKPKFSLEKGLYATWDWYIKHRELYA